MESRTKRIVLTVIALFLLVGCIFFLVYAAKYASAVLFEIEEGSNVETTEETVATETSETTLEEITEETTEETSEETTAAETTTDSEPATETTKEENSVVPQNSVKMPDLTGMNYKEAEEELKKFFEDNGLDIPISVGWGHNSNPDLNLKVICTTPAAGENVDSSTEVVIIMVYEGYNEPINN